MKFFLLSFVASAMSLGAVKLRITTTGYYYKNNKEVVLNIPKLNQELKKLGVDGIPEFVDVSGDPVPYYKLLLKRVNAANEATGREMHFNIADQGHGETYIYKQSMCYLGEITEIPELIEAMRGSFLNPEQGILAIGAGKRKVIIDEAFESRDGLKERFQDEYKSNLAAINQWLRYSEKSKTALVMSDYGPQGDGTELEVSEIPPCKDGN